MNTAFDSISIKIASPDQIKDESKKTSCKRRNPAQSADEPFICPERGTCSCGEVKKAETINYRSFRPEPEGLFCEAIFGPQKDWECNCGKYKRIKHKGMICDRCGVEITQQRVRRDRLGYIQLAAPVSHIWYFKGIPSRIGTFCELSSRDVERVLYFEGFIVVEALRTVTKVYDPNCPLEVGDIVSDTIGEVTLSNIDYRKMQKDYPGGFEAEIPYRVNHVPECPFEVGDEISPLERKRYPGLDVNETRTEEEGIIAEEVPDFDYQAERDPNFSYESEEWNDLSRDCRERDGWKCKRCSINLESDHHLLDAHHLFGTNRNDLEDLISLCIGCHTEVHSAEIDVERHDEFIETHGEKWKSLPKDSTVAKVWRVIKVSHPGCQLKVGDFVSDITYQQARQDYADYPESTVLSVAKLPPPCPHKVGDYISEAEYKEASKNYPSFDASICCPLEPGEVLSEIEYIDNSNKYWEQFRAGTGAEVIRKILSHIDLDAEIEKLTKELEATTSNQKKLKTAKQLKQMADFAEIGQRPEWMILDVIPVIPPDLRPLVPLEGGRFATSDLNDLYRRVINRNNRLRKLIQLRSPEVILRNEKRMLQEAVDAFFDNGRHGRRVTGPGNRPLKSLADVLKGKIGRFRQNLLGKRVDYSGRSVIVVGPELGLHQCGIPKRMAVELFKPFIIERLQAYGYTQTIKRAKHIAEHVDSDSPVWEVVEEVIADHPVLLNRPPTLHRLGIQAFLPVLVEGKSIRIPPLVCKAFNADFDGDQMAVHVPLTVEAQAEAKLLMLSSHNILKPSHGDPVAVPELDMVLGPSFLTKTLPEHTTDAALLHDAYTTRDPATFEALREKPWFHRRYAHPEEVITAHAAGQLKLHDSIQLFLASNESNGKTTEPILTTVGRVMFNEVLPSGLEWEDENSQQRLPFFNAEAGGRELSALIHRCFNELGTRVTTEVLEKVQKLGFEYATLSGISPGITDYITPDNRDALVDQAQADIDALSEEVAIVDSEEHENRQIIVWHKAIQEIEREMFNILPDLETSLVERGDPRKIHPYVDPDGSEIHDGTVEGFSPVHIMADSGARARKNPFTQISAVIGLKAKQSGEILIPPITTSYRDGLDVLDYFNSTYGSRKGLVDTAMKTAASGYLTRKLVDVAQDVRVTTEDCGTLNSILKFATDGGDLAFKISGRTAAEDILNPESGELLVPAGSVISAQMADQIDALGISVVKVRSVLTCQTDDGVCAKCYGNDLTTNDLVNVGEAVGIIAAQSIGEPGTQLTMRTFHTGGAVEDVSEARQRRILSKVDGTVYFRDFQPDRTVEKEGELWVATENRGNLDGPAYKVQQINHPECQLRVGELLSEKQYTENTERYKGFDTKPWQYEVTEVLDNDCDLKVGARLSQAEYVTALDKYGFKRFAKLHYRVTQVQHPDISAAVGDLILEEEVKRLEKIRDGFKTELYYLDPETDKLVKEEDLKLKTNISSGHTNAFSDGEERHTNFEQRYYRVTEVNETISKTFPFKVGQDVAQEEIAPWMNPFEVDKSKPVYVVHTEVADFAVDQTLTVREYEDARTAYQQEERAFKVEKQDIERHYVTAVYHPECPLKEGEELNEAALTRAHKRFTGFDAQRLRHRITQVHHPDCPLKPGNLISESEAKQFDETYPGFVTTQTKSTAGGFAAERMYRITAVNHPDCPLQVGDLLTQKESSANRRHYKGFEVARHYEVTHIEDGTTALSVGQRLTETEYKALRKADTTVPEKVKALYHVVSVHHPELEVEVDTELSEEDYKTYHRQFKGFDAELVYQITEDKRDVDEPLEVGTILPSKEFRALDKANLRITHTVTEVYHPHCQYAVGDELPEETYNEAARRYPGFEVDELSLQMRIEVETSDGNRVPHVIPTGYSFSLREGDSIRKGETLAELHERTANLDIVAGIPRVTELFEARRPKRGEAAEIAEIEGYVQSAGTKSGIPAYRIEHGTYQSRLYQIPDEKRRVAEGDWVNAGEPLTDGYLNPHDILSIGRTTIEGVSVEGEEAVWSYLVDEVQKVYGKGTINDKHVETIVRQMLTKIRITEPGDTNFYPNDEVQRKQFERVNSEIEENGGIPASGEPILQSISKAALSTDSFISAASFQQTTKVLTDAAVSGQTDRLFGLKENVILGRLIPAGSGFSSFQNLEVSAIESEIDEDD